MQKILVANRGEIAVRVMRSASEMGIKTVAVYSEADKNAPHVKLADEAYFIGPSPSSESYLVMDKILEVAKSSGADGIHPGYGFLSENAQFAKEVAKAGIKFIGPSPEAIRVMGNKLAAKDAVADYDIPMLGGTNSSITDVEEAKAVATKVGYPILIKAAAGGGGKGMRVVENAEELPSQMTRAISEAQSSFGDGSVFIEKYIRSPRHIEIQVLCDAHGNGVYLFERDCSIQRRHQKVVEEAPSAVLDDQLRNEMGQAALNVAKACSYEGAGTVEFLLDENKKFFFLEMNTRLQVEHPVTEMISGIDLVKEQIKVARGETLSFKQDDLRINGHAIELRIYAEDPAEGFLPSTGSLSTYRLPDGYGVRVDSGYEEGMDIPVYYDPMIAKLIVHAESREAAIEKMSLAIKEFRLEGIESTLPFGQFVMKHPSFRAGEYTTHFVKEHFKPELLKGTEEEQKIAALMAAYLHLESASNRHQAGQGTSKASETPSLWRTNRL